MQLQVKETGIHCGNLSDAGVGLLNQLGGNEAKFCQNLEWTFTMSDAEVIRLALILIERRVPKEVADPRMVLGLLLCERWMDKEELVKLLLKSEPFLVLIVTEKRRISGIGT